MISMDTIGTIVRFTLLICAIVPYACDAPDGGKDRINEGEQPSQQHTDAQADRDNEPIVIRPFDDITVHPESKTVEVRAWVCLDIGYLEQVACSPGTREHESLVVIRAKPSNIHASLLLVGFENGRPGRWEFDARTERLQLTPPVGDTVDVLFRYTNEDGETMEVNAREWIRDHHSEREFPPHPWVFGGSMFKANPEWMGPGEHYLADMTGSIIGLVTFGDEVIGLTEIISDQAAIHEPEWEVNTEAIPKIGTEVTVIIRPFERADDSAETAGFEDDAGDARSGSN